jgi:hypothetical protein
MYFTVLGSCWSWSAVSIVELAVYFTVCIFFAVCESSSNSVLFCPLMLPLVVEEPGMWVMV